MNGSSKKKVSRTAVILAMAACGQLLAIFPSCETTLTTLNPCGTIFGFCEPTDIDLMFADIPDFDLDPSCSIPYYGLDHEDAGDCATEPIYPTTPGPRP